MTTSVENCRWCVSNGLTGDDPVAENRSHFLMVKGNPSSPSALVVPFRHVETPFGFSAEEWEDLGPMLKEARNRLMVFHPGGFTIGWNVGAVGGQHVFHAHLHVLCRFQKDLSAGQGLRDFIVRRDP